jgi:hypothetical protein
MKTIIPRTVPYSNPAVTACLVILASLAVVAALTWSYRTYRGQSPNTPVSVTGRDITLDEGLEAGRKLEKYFQEMHRVPAEPTTAPATTRLSTPTTQPVQHVTYNVKLFSFDNTKLPDKIALFYVEPDTATKSAETAQPDKTTATVPATVKTDSEPQQAASHTNGPGPLSSESILKDTSPFPQTAADTSSKSKQLGPGPAPTQAPVRYSVLYFTRHPKNGTNEAWIKYGLTEKDFKRLDPNDPESPVTDVQGKKVIFGFTSKPYRDGDNPSYVWVKSNPGKQVDRHRELFRTYGNCYYYLSKDAKGKLWGYDTTAGALRETAWPKTSGTTVYEGKPFPVTPL